MIGDRDLCCAQHVQVHVVLSIICILKVYKIGHERDGSCMVNIKWVAVYPMMVYPMMYSLVMQIAIFDYFLLGLIAGRQLCRLAVRVKAL